MAQSVWGIFERAPAEAFENVASLAALHVNVAASLGNIEECFALAERYERKFLPLPGDDIIRGAALCGIYFCLGLVRSAYAYDDSYDFDVYFARMYECLTPEISGMIPLADCPRGPWINLTYSSKAGAPQKYSDAVVRSEEASARFFGGVSTGADFLVRGELQFYKGNFKAAEPLIVRAAENSAKRGAYETLHRALFYQMRIAVAEGNIKKAETALSDIENLLSEQKYYQRFTSYDIAFGWLQYILRQPDTFPRWLSEKFSFYSHASAAENFGNQIKARYCYLTRNFTRLFSYVREMRQRESFLYGRIEMLAMEACAHYQMKNKTKAWASLREAYETSAPNDILTPFFELGKDMRTLASAALNEMSAGTAPNIGIPRSWLESIKHKATSYAKNQSMFITRHKLSSGSDKVLSAREHEVLGDLYNGLSQSEIAAKRNLSLNTIKLYTKNLYDKLHVHKVSDLIRVAVERGLV
jgi:ATP/maltotriose-dependent transcriptional regulator MalT